ncbi:MAG: hypothetical protein IJS74_02350 [Clostridia bacterium]|nr:hypothetical protein [Clostridia bacterium]
MFDAFVTLFSQADWIFFVLFALGLGLFITKIFVENKLLLAITGIFITICAITERCAVGNNNSTQIFFYIVYIILLIAVVYAIVKLSFEIASANKIRKKMAKVKGNNVPLTPEGNPDYSFLKGKVGMVVSDLKPTGKVEIQGAIYEVSSISDYISAGCVVKVVKVMASRVFVEKQ